MRHLERALDGNNQWWKYLLACIGIIVATGIGSIPFFMAMPGNDIMTDFSAYGVSPHYGLALMLLPFIITFIALKIIIARLHRRTLAETINGTHSIRWNRFFTGAAFWGAACLVAILLNLAIDPDNFRYSFDPLAFIPLLLVSFVLIPFQASFEEVLMRGYLAQGFGAWTRNRWIVLLIPSLLFALLHFSNTEVIEHGFWITMPQYLFIGLLLGLVTILDDGLEVAMGIHSVNNILGSILITNDSSTFQTPALLTELHVDPLKDLLLEVLIGIVVLLALAKRYKWKFNVLNKKIHPAPFPSNQQLSELPNITSGD